ncbi:UNVERIFIED_CONTAM: hypothetical protein Sradi_7242000 [Sesamum radiatum]|uniref:Uncharacterized protein n=1 Tax=Sesamum radiatum TaxID=300843 RepID=A0AAW2IN92_SESRA
MPNVLENSSSHRSSFSLRSSRVFIPCVNSGTSSPNINGAVVALSPVFPSEGSVGQRDRKLGKREYKHLLQAMHSHLAKAKENMCLAQLRKGLESLRITFIPSLKISQFYHFSYLRGLMCLSSIAGIRGHFTGRI